MRILLISAEFPPDIGGVGDYTRRLALALVDRGHDIAVLTGRYGLVEFRRDAPPARPYTDFEFRVGDERSDDAFASQTGYEAKTIENSNSQLAKPSPKLGTRSEELGTRVRTRWRRVPTEPVYERAAGASLRNSKLETWSLRPIESAIDEFRPEVVHLQYQTGAYGMHPAVLLLPARLRRAKRRVPFVVTAHDLRLPFLFPKAGVLRQWLTGRLLGDAGAVIITNQCDAQRLAGLAPANRELYSPRRPLKTPHVVIPIGSNIEPSAAAAYDRGAYRSTAGAGPDSVVVAYFGLLSRSKGVLELLQAIAWLPPRFRLLIIGGSAPLPDDRRFAVDVEAAIEKLGLRERVTITGPLPQAEVSALLLASDLAALPFADGVSYRRGSLLAVLAHGLPTITTRPSEPLAPPLLDGRHALLLPPADAESLRTAIERLAADRLLSKTLSAGARELAAGFGWPAIAELHESVYHELL